MGRIFYVFWGLGLKQKKARYPEDSGLSELCGAGEMNRTPDLLITNDAKEEFDSVDMCR
jgi:hypothetical protein